jgi:hypothetical protein
MYAYHSVLPIMPNFRMLFFLDVSLVGRFEGFIPANQRNENSAKTYNFAVAAFLI